MRKVIVTGGRDYENWDAVKDVLDFLKPDLIIEGGATGADTFAAEWASLNNIPSHTYDADWKKLGKVAGPERNRRMIRENKDAIVVAFPGGSGTAHCIRVARALGVTVLKVEP